LDMTLQRPQTAPHASLAQSDEHEVSQSALICPITNRIFEDPVLCTADGRTYEKKAIEKWISERRSTPFTNPTMVVRLDSIVPNRFLKSVLRKNRKQLFIKSLQLSYGDKWETFLEEAKGDNEEEGEYDGGSPPLTGVRSCIVVELEDSAARGSPDAGLFLDLLRSLSCQRLPVSVTVVRCPGPPGSFEVSVLHMPKDSEDGKALSHKCYSKASSYCPLPTVQLLCKTILSVLRGQKYKEARWLEGPHQLPDRWRKHVDECCYYVDCRRTRKGGKLMLPSLMVWNTDDIDGTIVPAVRCPPKVKPIQLCMVVPDARVQGVELENCRLSFHHAVELCSFIANNRTVRKISLRKLHLDHEVASLLAQSLSINTKVTSLDLRENNIGPEGATALSSVLRSRCSLKSLSLYGNAITTAGACELARALEHNSTLSQLDLGDNLIDDEGLVRISKALVKTTSLTSLQLQPTGPRDRSRGAILGSLKDVSGSVALFEAVDRNSSLLALNVGANAILSKFDPKLRSFRHVPNMLPFRPASAVDHLKSSGRTKKTLKGSRERSGDEIDTAEFKEVFERCTEGNFSNSPRKRMERLLAEEIQKLRRSQS